jgi:hypothetical protein
MFKKNKNFEISQTVNSIKFQTLKHKWKRYNTKLTDIIVTNKLSHLKIDEQLIFLKEIPTIFSKEKIIQISKMLKNNV